MRKINVENARELFEVRKVLEFSDGSNEMVFGLRAAVLCTLLASGFPYTKLRLFQRPGNLPFVMLGGLA